MRFSTYRIFYPTNMYEYFDPFTGWSTLRDCDFIYSNPALYGTYVINFTRFHDPFKHFSDEPFLEMYKDPQKDAIISIYLYKQFRSKVLEDPDKRLELAAMWQSGGYLEEMQAIAEITKYPYPGNKSIKKNG